MVKLLFKHMNAKQWIGTVVILGLTFLQVLFTMQIVVNISVLTAAVQSSKEKGVWAELGSAVMVALQDKITLCESQEQSIYWGLESHVKVPLEISAGYRFPLGAVSLEAALFGAYDLTNSTTFVVNERKLDARAWNVGARFVLWAVRL